MSEEFERSKQGSRDSQRYEIRLRGRLDVRWQDRFEGMRFSYENDGTTVLSGPVADQAALHGLLRQVRDLALPLLSVNPVASNSNDKGDNDNA